VSKTDRISAIRKLEQVRKSRVIAYVTADRGLVSVPVAEDVVPIVYAHLRTIGQTDRLDVFLYSRGGDTNTPWPLVSICRSFAKHFAVVIPYRAHSAATQISMGADEIVMGPLAELTQVDPSLRTDYTPPNPAQAGQTLAVSVEDLRGYFEFFKGLNLGEGATNAVIEVLRDKVHPLAIGQVQRALGSIQYISKRLLAMHIKNAAEVDRIAKAMVTEMHVHSHKVKQPEAKEIGLPAVAASHEEAEAMWELYSLYEQEMELRKPIRPSSLFPNVNDAYVELKDQKMAYVESAARTDVYLMDIFMARTLQSVQTLTIPVVAPAAPAPPAPPSPTRPVWGPNVSFSVERESWSTE
jgi:hypothetical protein